MCLAHLIRVLRFWLHKLLGSNRRSNEAQQYWCEPQPPGSHNVPLAKMNNPFMQRRRFCTEISIRTGQ
ncbi:hypothetical protein BN126310240 [Stenotrophomonas thermophila]|nr:hypothetical protein BN126310240 [Stenotrophomonas maltophilia]